jgi:hypothetical protein
VVLDPTDARLLDTILNRDLEEALASPAFRLRLVGRPEVASLLAETVTRAEGGERDTAFALLTRFPAGLIGTILEVAPTARPSRAVALLDAVWGILCDVGRLERQRAIAGASEPLRDLLSDRRWVVRELAPDTERDVELRVCDEAYLLIARLGQGDPNESEFRMATTDERDVYLARLMSRLGRVFA